MLKKIFDLNTKLIEENSKNAQDKVPISYMYRSVIIPEMDKYFDEIGININPENNTEWVEFSARNIKHFMIFGVVILISVFLFSVNLVDTIFMFLNHNSYKGTTLMINLVTILNNIDQLSYFLMCIFMFQKRTLWFNSLALWVPLVITVLIITPIESYAFGYPDKSEVYWIGVIVLVSIIIRDLYYYLATITWCHVLYLEYLKMIYLYATYIIENKTNYSVKKYLPMNTKIFLFFMLYSVLLNIAMSTITFKLLLASLDLQVIWILLRMLIPLFCNSITLFIWLRRDKLIDQFIKKNEIKMHNLLLELNDKRLQDDLIKEDKTIKEETKQNELLITTPVRRLSSNSRSLLDSRIMYLEDELRWISKMKIESDTINISFNYISTMLMAILSVIGNAIIQFFRQELNVT